MFGDIRLVVNLWNWAF